MRGPRKMTVRHNDWYFQIRCIDTETFGPFLMV